MKVLALKANHRIIKDFYKGINELAEMGSLLEGNIAPYFADILRHCARLMGFKFIEQHPIHRKDCRPLRADGAVLYADGVLHHGIWEAKDLKDDLEKEIESKFNDGYPQDNILFQTPDQLVIYQNGKRMFNENIANDSKQLIVGLKLFFEYSKPEINQWHEAVDKFKDKFSELGQKLVAIIEHEFEINKDFKQAFDSFETLCKTAINPNLSTNAIQEMLIQHFLTERIFRNVFDNPDFVRKNAIAVEIEKVIYALTSESFSREVFIKENQLDRFYTALENAAKTIADFSEKQTFLNGVYERFFQGFAVKVADTHGIVYTPQSIVNFMVQSVQDILKKEFNKSLPSSGVHILDPFVGTGNFIVRIINEIAQTDPFALEYKYLNELHCNEVMLLPYYIAAMNIEHTYYEKSKRYKPFSGICLVDTFELAEEKQKDLFTEENTQRVKKQKETDIYVIIGNPPYNAGQVNENDNNKNRQYKTVDNWVKTTYAKDSTATNKNALSDPYVKAIRWASNRIGDTGIVAFVSNNSFLENVAFDGMRKHLTKDFSKIYCLDLGGNVRKNPKLSGTTHNVFGIQVGVSINVLVKNSSQKTTQIHYARLDEFWKKSQKYAFLESKQNVSRVKWQRIKLNEKQIWLTEGLHPEFKGFIPLGTQETKSTKNETEGVFFKVYSRGAGTCRDAWVYHFKCDVLVKNMQKTIETYNTEVFRWQMWLKNTKNSQKFNELDKYEQTITIDNFVSYDSKRISWCETLKSKLRSAKYFEFNEEKIRTSLYRPFTKTNLFFDRSFVARVHVFPSIFPTLESEKENRVICLNGIGGNKPLSPLMTSIIPDLGLIEATQCFPFYTYSEDGTGRTENITDWILNHCQQHYKDKSLNKWDIFYYVYGLLHSPHYRTKYAVNLKKELPRLPLVKTLNNFKQFSAAGKQLADLHLNYETQPEFELERVYNHSIKQSLRVEKMRLSKDKTALRYNEFLTLKGIPPEVFEYRLGNRSALEWIVDQYRVKVDKRSGIENNPNRLDDPQYILRLIGQIITVSLETVRIVNEISKLDIDSQ